MDAWAWMLLVRAVSALHRLCATALIAYTGGKSIRAGFVLDIVGYGERAGDGRACLQRRLDDIVRLVLDDLGIVPGKRERQNSGDGVLVILPGWLDTQRFLPVLLRSTAEYLRRDNALFSDRMRVRMAADIGPVVESALGFDGLMVTSMGRLVNSTTLRQHVIDYPDCDLSVLVSDTLHRFVVAERVPGLCGEHFSYVGVREKELVAAAWLWQG